MLLHGIFPPVTTPFYPDGKVYLKKLESNVERYSRTPCAGIVVLGSTGEAILLSDQERRDVLKTAREAAAPNKVLVAGTGIESAIETLRLTEYAAELGYDLSMVRMLAASTGSSGGELVQVGAMTGADSMVSSKPSSSAVTIVGKMKTRQKEVGFQVLVGAAQKLHPSLEAGAVGAILAFGCLAPTACYEIYAAWKEGDGELARLKQERIAQAAQKIVGDLGIPGVKYGMDFNGYFGGTARLPLLPLTGEVKVEVERLLGDVRN